jgi:hypothetical protein
MDKISPDGRACGSIELGVVDSKMDSRLESRVERRRPIGSQE